MEETVKNPEEDITAVSEETTDIEPPTVDGGDTVLPLCEEGENCGEGEAYYEELMASDLEELKGEFPELSGIESLTDIKNPLRYAALRDLGLTPTEAYLAARGKVTRDTRSHLTGGIPRPAAAPLGSMSKKELEGARELFSGMSDTEIQKLWRRVTK